MCYTRITFNKETSYKGRNGFGRQTGIEVFQGDGEIRLTPTNTKGCSDAASIGIRIESLEDFLLAIRSKFPNQFDAAVKSMNIFPKTKDSLLSLAECCREALDGRWDASSDGFIAMLDEAEVAIDEMGIQPEYPKTMNQAVKMWERLGDIPVDENDELEEHFYNIFSPGDSKEEVWSWFESYFNLSVAEDLMIIKMDNRKTEYPKHLFPDFETMLKYYQS